MSEINKIRLHKEYFDKNKVMLHLRALQLMVCPKIKSIKVDFSNRCFIDSNLNVTLGAFDWMIPLDEESFSKLQIVTALHEFEHGRSSCFNSLSDFADEFSGVINGNQQTVKKIAYSLSNCIEDGRIERISIEDNPKRAQGFKTLRAYWWTNLQEAGNSWESDALMNICSYSTTGLFLKGWKSAYPKDSTESDIVMMNKFFCQKNLRKIREVILANDPWKMKDRMMELVRDNKDFFQRIIDKTLESNDIFEKIMDSLLKAAESFAGGLGEEFKPLKDKSGNGIPIPSSWLSSESKKKDKEGSSGSSGDSIEDSEDKSTGTSDGSEGEKSKEGKTEDCADESESSTSSEINQNIGPSEEENGELSQDNIYSYDANDYTDYEPHFEPDSVIDNIIKEAQKKIEDIKLPEISKTSASKSINEKPAIFSNKDFIMGAEKDIFESKTAVKAPISIVKPGVRTLPYNEKPDKNLISSIISYKKKNMLNNYRSGILDSSQLARAMTLEPNIFKRKAQKQKSAAFYILIDRSGSMCDEHKWHDAIKSAASIESALSNGPMPLRITSFSATREVSHHIIKDFDEWKQGRSFSTGYGSVFYPTGGNMDGLSIRIATSELLQRPEDTKILIVISDGMPAAPSYSSNNQGVNDTRNAVKSASSKGIQVIGVAIGSEQERERNKESYKFIYGKNLVMGNNQVVPKALSKIISGHL